MDEQQALAIVSALANGANPSTGEPFPADSPYQTPEVIRALFVALRHMEARAQNRPARLSNKVQSDDAPARGTSASHNAGKSWTAEEDKQLLAAFDADKPLTEIARLHGRTVGGVRARLEKHGRLEPSPATRWPIKDVKESAAQYSQHKGANGSANRPA